MALGMMGASGSWTTADDEKKKRERELASKGFSGSALGIQGLGATVDQAMPQLRAKEQRYPISQDGKNQMSNQIASMGINTANPLVPGTKKPEPQWNPKDYPSVYAGKPVQPTSPNMSDKVIADTYREESPSNIGFNPVNNQQVVRSAGGGAGFRMPNAPTRGWSERQERDSLLRDASTAYKGSQNGQLTAKQMELRAGIIGADDKARNDQYGAQLSAASQLTQAQMSQDGANTRAAIGEANSNNRFNSQLGFDAAKFQQTASAEQERSGLDARRLDMQQANNDVANFAPKQLNALYEKFDAAQSDEDRSSIAKQIQSLKGVADKKSKPVVITQTGESPLPGGLGGVKKNPSIIYDPDSGQFTNLPKKEINFSDPEVLAIVGNRDLSDEEMQAQIAALYS